MSYVCPNCNNKLIGLFKGSERILHCKECRGRFIPNRVVKRKLGGNFYSKLKKKSQKATEGGRGCPHCLKTMSLVSFRMKRFQLELDLCSCCKSIWFDPSEFQQLEMKEKRQQAYAEEPPNQESYYATLISLGESNKFFEVAMPAPLWKKILLFLRFPIKDNFYATHKISKKVLTLVWGMLVGTILVQFFPSASLKLFALQPDDFILLIPFKTVSYFFLHGNWVHFIMNAFALILFSDEIANILDSQKFFGLLLGGSFFSGLVFLVFSKANVPLVGASGGVYALMTYYCFKFPFHKFYILIKFPMQVPAIFFLFIYSLMNYFGVLMLVSDVSTRIAYTAHLGGILAGIAFWFASGPIFERS